jgi:hypothetical protein
MSSGDKQQSNAKVMEWIAFAGVVAFGLGISYAIYITSQTVNKVKANHYPPEAVVSSNANASNTPTTTLNN